MRATLPAEPGSALEARQCVEQFVGQRGGRDSAAALVASELVTNAIVHARTPVRFSLRLDDDSQELVIEVGDSAVYAPAILRANRPGGLDGGTSGRGLAMVERLASDWGVRPEAGGKTVWAVVPLSARTGP